MIGIGKLSEIYRYTQIGDILLDFVYIVIFFSQQLKKICDRLHTIVC